MISVIGNRVQHGVIRLLKIPIKMICDLFRKQKVISFWGCIAQIFFSHAVGGTEMVLLIAMAFDRYVAICKPLQYLTIMSPRMCLQF